jgi:hypothetical protein
MKESCNFFQRKHQVEEDPSYIQPTQRFIFITIIRMGYVNGLIHTLVLNLPTPSSSISNVKKLE